PTLIEGNRSFRASATRYPCCASSAARTQLEIVRQRQRDQHVMAGGGPELEYRVTHCQGSGRSGASQSTINGARCPQRQQDHRGHVLPPIHAIPQKPAFSTGIFPSDAATGRLAQGIVSEVLEASYHWPPAAA